MASSSRRWATVLSRFASAIFFLLIFLQVPLFRVPCSSAICTTPLELAFSHLFACKTFPEAVAKTLLFPGAVANAFVKNRAIPSYNSLLSNYDFINARGNAPATTDFPRLEVILGSYVSVLGAFFGLLRPGRMSLVGTCLVVWGIITDDSIIKIPNADAVKASYVYPSMLAALVFSFMSIRGDMRRMIQFSRSCLPRRTSLREKEN